MSYINNWARRFRAGISSATPFKSMGMDWCPTCKRECECDTASHHNGTIYAYKRWCTRCGRVLLYGVYDNVPLIGLTRPLPPAALEWVTEPAQDRR